MKLPITYPSDYSTNLINFKQWTNKSFLPANSEVVILEERDTSFKLLIPHVRMTFEIGKKFAEIVEK